MLPICWLSMVRKLKFDLHSTPSPYLFLMALLLGSESLLFGLCFSVLFFLVFSLCIFFSYGPDVWWGDRRGGGWRLRWDNTTKYVHTRAHIYASAPPADSSLSLSGYTRSLYFPLGHLKISNTSSLLIDGLACASFISIWRTRGRRSPCVDCRLFSLWTWLKSKIPQISSTPLPQDRRTQDAIRHRHNPWSMGVFDYFYVYCFHAHVMDWRLFIFVLLIRIFDMGYTDGCKFNMGTESEF